MSKSEERTYEQRLNGFLINLVLTAFFLGFGGVIVAAVSVIVGLAYFVVIGGAPVDRDPRGFTEMWAGFIIVSSIASVIGLSYLAAHIADCRSAARKRDAEEWSENP